MPDVNPSTRSPEPMHLAYLLHRATQRLRAEGEEQHGSSGRLQAAAQARLLDLVPAEGGRVSDLAKAMRTSKQGLGQLAMQLAAMGYVEMTPDPADKRAKILTRTPAGDRERLARRSVVDLVEDRWRTEVGAERYATFREVLAVVAGVTVAADD